MPHRHRHDASREHAQQQDVPGAGSPGGSGRVKEYRALPGDVHSPLIEKAIRSD